MRRALAVAVCSSLLLSGCGRKREYPPPDRYVPADAPLAVLVSLNDVCHLSGIGETPAEAYDFEETGEG